MPGKRFPLTSATRQDIRDALAFTKKRFGDAKARDYASLIRLALHAITNDAHAGKPRPEIDPDAFAYPIARPGRNARHLFLYEIVDDEARIYGLFYDGMDLPAHWKERSDDTTVEDE
jgi:plasmid stabilization system protein ParE